jgi:hypothetical protein
VESLLKSLIVSMFSVRVGETFSRYGLLILRLLSLYIQDLELFLCVLCDNGDENYIKLDPNYRNVELSITTGPGSLHKCLKKFSSSILIGFYKFSVTITCISKPRNCLLLASLEREINLTITMSNKVSSFFSLNNCNMQQHVNQSWKLNCLS